MVLDLDSKSSTSIVLRCIVDSFPRSQISWYRHGQKLAEGSLFNLENITTREQQGIYSYRIETEGFQTLEYDLIIYIKGWGDQFEMNEYFCLSFIRQTIDLSG